MAKRTRKPRTDAISDMLRAMPIDKRADTIVQIFSVISAEFAKMVLEHVKPERPPKRRPKPPSS